jgi:iron(III) transport system permease protein
MITGVLVVLCYLVLGPLAVLFIASVRTPELLPFDTGSTWTLESYVTVLTNPHLYELLWNTLSIGAGSMVVAFVLSVILAWLVERTNIPAPNVAAVLIILGLGLPGFISGISWIVLGNPTNGLLNEWLRTLPWIDGNDGPLNIFSAAGFIFVQGINFVPATFLLVAAAFRAMDVRLEEAATISGAGTWTTLRRITLPVLAPALIGAFIYMFITVVESFDIPLTIGLRADIRVLSSEVYLNLHPAVGFPDYSMASVHGVILLIVGIAPLWYYNRVLKRADQYATIGSRSSQRKRIDLGSLRWPAGIFVGLYVMASLILPALVMVWTSIQPFYALPSAESFGRINFDSYGQILSSPGFYDALRNTAVVAILAPLLVMTLALFTSWIVVRSTARGRTLLDALAFMPHVIPTPVLALALLLIYLSLQVPIYGTVWILVIAIMTRYIGLSTRLMNAGVTSLQRELEEAALVSGATAFTTMRRIVFPLVLPSYINGFVMVALLAVQQLAMPLILASSSNNVLSTLVWGRWVSGDTGPATALGVIVLAISMLIAVIGRRLGGLRD